MSSSPPTRTPWRVPRAHLEGTTPAVLRFANGERVGASLQVISLTGGLLSLSEPVLQGSQVKLMFLTGAGSVLGGAEMLPPVNPALQPFRFVSLAADDHRRLGELIWERSGQNKSEQVWIEKLRASAAQHYEVRPWQFRLARAVGLVTIGLATVACLLHFGLLK
jgi:hypothetical protein